MKYKLSNTQSQSLKPNKLIKLQTGRGKGKKILDLKAEEPKSEEVGSASEGIFGCQWHHGGFFVMVVIWVNGLVKTTGLNQLLLFRFILLLWLLFEKWYYRIRLYYFRTIGVEITKLMHNIALIFVISEPIVRK